VFGFVRANRSGLDWLKTPGNKAAAIDILSREMLETTPAAAAENYGFLIVASPVLPVSRRMCGHRQRL
jgi:hypothetical protein